MKKVALITGISGQDGSYLAEFLLDKEYEVHGIIRRTSISKLDRIEHLINNSDTSKNVILHSAEVCDAQSLTSVLYEVKPQEIYNLAGQSEVGVSFSQPAYTADVTGLSTLRLLEAMRQLGLKSHFCQAGSSELLGQVSEMPQNENTKFNPVNPYAVAKNFAHSMTTCYRNSYGMFASNGILFSHESPRRGENFVCKKISKAAARIKLGIQNVLYLGNLDAKRDWGYAKDYVEAMWLILQHEKPDDFVIASGEAHSVKDFLDEAFGLLNLEWREFVKIDQRYMRPQEAQYLCGDYSKARKILGWQPATKWKDLVRIMVEADLEEEKFRKNRERHPL